MKDFFKADRWSPYIVGVLLAALSVASFFFFGNMLGSSTTFVRLAGTLLSVFTPGYVHNNHYYASYGPLLSWQTALILGVFIGSYLAGAFHRKSPDQTVPTVWKKNFGPNKKVRYFGAFCGGVIILLGARIAGGCTSGHAISGGMQLAVSGWVFMISLFAVGVPTALLLYRKGK